MKLVKTAGRVFNLEAIVFAQIYPSQTDIFPVDYHVISLAGDEAQRMNEALKDAGFVGEGTLINPERISAIEDAGSLFKVFLDGADRVVFIAPELVAGLFPALESSLPAYVVEKTRDSSPEPTSRSDRRKKAQ